MIENTPVRNVRLYGALGAKFGRCFRLAVKSPAEAVQALTAQLPGFEKHLVDSKDKGIGYGVFVGKKGLTQEELVQETDSGDIRIAPIMFGAKKQGWGSIIVGAILVIVGFILMFTPFAALSPMFFQMGIAMMVGGVIQLLMPVPKGQGGQDSPENNPSYTFNGPLNTQAQGHPVPLLYGKMMTGSAVISAGIDTDDNSSGGAGGPGGTGSRVGGGWIGVVVNRVINDR